MIGMNAELRELLDIMRSIRDSLATIAEAAAKVAEPEEIELYGMAD